MKIIRCYSGGSLERLTVVRECLNSPSIKYLGAIQKVCMHQCVQYAYRGPKIMTLMHTGTYFWRAPYPRYSLHTPCSVSIFHTFVSFNSYFCISLSVFCKTDWPCFSCWAHTEAWICAMVIYGNGCNVCFTEWEHCMMYVVFSNIYA
jgi:hypothetical protein